MMKNDKKILYITILLFYFISETMVFYPKVRPLYNVSVSIQAIAFCRLL
jgi:hypothetical protein